MNTNITKFLDSASAAYYTGQPIITDAQFDALADSVGYNKVGYVPGAKTAHAFPMFSLQKYYEDEGARPLAEYTDLVASAKLDGAAISLLYLGGALLRVLTRGDGTQGVDITDKFLSTASLVPHTINYTGLLQVTGEVVAPLHVENARNYAAGSLNLKDVAEFKTRAISFFAYNINTTTPLHKTYREDLQWLEANGFATVSDPELVKIFPTDGMVFRVNNNELFQELGFTSKHPRGAYAKKIRAEHVETKLLAVEWQVGKSGKVTPVAILEPVLIGDATVSRATLNNPGFIEMLGLEIGDTVAVARAGEIIPCILHKVEA